MSFLDSWGLTLAVFVPLVGLAVLLLIPRGSEEVHRAVALVTTVVTAAVGIALAIKFDYGASRSLQFEINKSWIDVISSRYHMGLDGISLPLLLLSMVITVLCVVYSWDHFPEPHNPKAFLEMT